jgi:FKBP-type peptidyl-prolyl cis-trans isomerase SlyD
LAQLQTIAGDTVVGLAYTLKNDAGEVLDQSEGDDLLFYLHGHDNIVPGLERKLSGRQVGEKLQVSVVAADGYGERDVRGEQKVPRDAFPNDMPLEPGMQLATQDEDGNMIPLWVVKVEPQVVHIDMNHPLAGQTLHFDVEIKSVRAASAEELDHGHPHGPDGHHHH